MGKLSKLRMNWAHGSQHEFENGLLGFCLRGGENDPVSWAESGEPESSFPLHTQDVFPCCDPYRKEHGADDRALQVKSW